MAARRLALTPLKCLCDTLPQVLIPALSDLDRNDPMPSHRPSPLYVILTAALACTLATRAFADSGVSTLEERMSQKDFQSSGLNKLTPAELAHLNAWLGARPIVAGENGAVASEPVFYPKDSAREAFNAHIVGTFQGWRGKTRYTLDNDQVWEQAESGRLGDIELTDPAVRIKPMLLGSWLMYVDGCGCSLRVKRVE